MHVQEQEQEQITRTRTSQGTSTGTSTGTSIGTSKRTRTRTKNKYKIYLYRMHFALVGHILWRYGLPAGSCSTHSLPTSGCVVLPDLKHYVLVLWFLY